LAFFFMVVSWSQVAFVHLFMGLARTARAMASPGKDVTSCKNNPSIVKKALPWNKCAGWDVLIQ
jgi:hypothetical protein